MIQNTQVKREKFEKLWNLTLKNIFVCASLSYPICFDVLAWHSTKNHSLKFWKWSPVNAVNPWLKSTNHSNSLNFILSAHFMQTCNLHSRVRTINFVLLWDVIHSWDVKVIRHVEVKFWIKEAKVAKVSGGEVIIKFSSSRRSKPRLQCVSLMSCLFLIVHFLKALF